jgi:hydrogenase-4 component F
MLLNASLLNPIVVKVAFILAFVGYGTKVGLAPMHTWLPDAHSKAPAPVSALLSGALLNVALLSILRLKIVTDVAIGQSFSQGLMIFFGTLSIVIAAFIILGQKSYKRLMAYSSIEHMGIASLGFGFGGVGVFFALLHMIYHSITKSLLFFVSGNVFLKYSSTKIAKVKGVITSLPVTGTLLVIAFLAITGVPPFGIFITEFSILSAGIANHIIYSIIVLFCLALVFVGFFRHIVHLIFGHSSEKETKGENGFWTLLTPIILALLLVVLSFYLPAPLKTLISSASSLIK